MIRRALLTGHWKPYLERAISLKPCYEGGINGGEVAAHILQEIAFGKDYASDKLFPDALMILRFYVEIFKVFQIQRVSQRGWQS
ncbi:L-arabinokinase-like [Populus alba]